MFDLINSLKKETSISVCGENHIVQTKTFYVTASEKENWYAKFVFEDHSILVIAPFDDFMYYGKIQNVFGDGESFNDSIMYDGIKFHKDAEDYQIVKQLVFGDPLIAEGEVRYADYTSEENDSIIISLAVVSRTKKRADVIASIISPEDIVVE